jgi:hypothetical protein
MLSAGSIACARAGDLFLFLLARELHMEIAYDNHSGLASCCMLKGIALKNPVFSFTDFDASLRCESAFIEPSFDELLTRGAIIVKCTLEKAVLLEGAVQNGAEEESPMIFDNTIAALVQRLKGIVYGTMHATLVVHDDTVTFLNYEAHSDDVRLLASGSATEQGDLDIDLSLFFSPEMTGAFPEEVSALLVEKPRGWTGYSISVERKHDTSFVKIESDRFTFNFKRVEQGS